MKANDPLYFTTGAIAGGVIVIIVFLYRVEHLLTQISYTLASK